MSNTMTGSESAAGNRKVKLEIKNMTKHYDNGDGVENINLKVYENEIVTFLGPPDAESPRFSGQSQDFWM